MISAARTLRELALGVAALVTVDPLLAHHDWPVDRTTPITVHGTVTAFNWANPHVTIALDVDANGTIEKWKVGASSPKYMSAGGWEKNTLKPGDVVTINGYRYRDGSTMAVLKTIVLANGKELYYASRP